MILQIGRARSSHGRGDYRFGANALVRFDPKTEQFTTIRLSHPDAAVRQLLGRKSEVWGAESGADRLVVVRTGSPP